MNPQVLHFIIGIPGSGKSTLAARIVEHAKGTCYRVNKDDLRKMFTNIPKGSSNQGYNKEFEALVRETERATAESLLDQGYSVVVDDTNISKKHLNFFKTLAEKYGAEFRPHDLTDVPLETCLFQNVQRPKDERVPDEVVKHMHVQVKQNEDTLSRNLPVDVEEEKYIVCDIDGTLADANHRIHYVRNIGNRPDWKKNWSKFFAAAGEDRLRLDVAQMLVSYKGMGYPIILVSARPEYLRELTSAWLRDFGIQYDGLLMRENKDSRDDTIVKKEILDKYLQKEKIFRVIDDRPKVIQMWKDNGLHVIDVGLGEDF